MKQKVRPPKYSYTITLATIGDKLTELRVSKGYSTRLDFTTDHDLPHIQYWRMEKGTANLTFKSLDKVLKIHGLTIEQLFLSLMNEKRRPLLEKSRIRS
jgi:hypothetical protein